MGVIQSLSVCPAVCLLVGVCVKTFRLVRLVVGVEVINRAHRAISGIKFEGIGIFSLIVVEDLSRFQLDTFFTNEALNWFIVG